MAFCNQASGRLQALSWLCFYDMFWPENENHDAANKSGSLLTAVRAGLLQQRKLKPGRKALNEVLVHVVNGLKSPNRRDGLKFGIFIVRTSASSSWATHLTCAALKSIFEST